MKNSILIFLCILYLSINRINANPMYGPEVIVADDGEFPFAVSLGKAPATNIGDHFCGGTLIAKKLILTAKICLVRDDGRPTYKNTDIRVTVGSNDHKCGIKYMVESWKTYDQWAKKKHIEIGNVYHDIAIVTLTKDVNEVPPATLSQLTRDQVECQNAVLVGWGATQFWNDPEVLLKSSLYVITLQECLDYFIEIEVRGLHSGSLCTHTFGRLPVTLASGDAGGPLIINGNEVAGVNTVPLIHPYNDNRQNNLHQSVDYYRQFIEDSINKASSSRGGVLSRMFGGASSSSGSRN